MTRQAGLSSARHVEARLGGSRPGSAGAVGHSRALRVAARRGSAGAAGHVTALHREACHGSAGAARPGGAGRGSAMRGAAWQGRRVGGGGPDECLSGPPRTPGRPLRGGGRARRVRAQRVPAPHAQGAAGRGHGGGRKAVARTPERTVRGRACRATVRASPGARGGQGRVNECVPGRCTTGDERTALTNVTDRGTAAMAPTSVVHRPKTLKQWLMADIQDAHKLVHLIGVIGDDAELTTFRTVAVRTKDEVDAAAREWGETPRTEDRHWYRVRLTIAPGRVLVVEYCDLAEVPPADVDMLGRLHDMAGVSVPGVAA